MIRMNSISVLSRYRSHRDRITGLFPFQIGLRPMENALALSVKLEALEQIGKTCGGILLCGIEGDIHRLFFLLNRGILKHLHAEADLAVGDFEDPDLDLLAFLDNFGRIVDALLAHLGDMDQTVDTKRHRA